MPETQTKPTEAEVRKPTTIDLLNQLKSKVKAKERVAPPKEEVKPGEAYKAMDEEIQPRTAPPGGQTMDDTYNLEGKNGIMLEEHLPLNAEGFLEKYFSKQLLPGVRKQLIEALQIIYNAKQGDRDLVLEIMGEILNLAKQNGFEAPKEALRVLVDVKLKKG